jgi:hypothetical protein
MVIKFLNPLVRKYSEGFLIFTRIDGFIGFKDYLHPKNLKSVNPKNP